MLVLPDKLVHPLDLIVGNPEVRPVAIRVAVGPHHDEVHAVDRAVIVRMRLIGDTGLLPELVGQVGDGLRPLGRVVLVVVADDQREVVGVLEPRCLCQLVELVELVELAVVGDVAHHDDAVVVGAVRGDVLEHVLHAVDVGLIVEGEVRVAHDDELCQRLAVIRSRIDLLRAVERAFEPGFALPAMSLALMAVIFRTAATGKAPYKKRTGSCPRELDERSTRDDVGHGILPRREIISAIIARAPAVSLRNGRTTPLRAQGGAVPRT